MTYTQLNVLHDNYAQGSICPASHTLNLLHQSRSLDDATLIKNDQ